MKKRYKSLYIPKTGFYIEVSNKTLMDFRKSDAIGFIVTNNPQAASIFNYYGIDFYSRGDRTLEDACIEDNVPMSQLLEELYELKDKSDAPNFASMNMVALATYILRTHHKFTEKKLVFIKNTLDRLVWSCGETDRNVILLREMFEELSVYLRVHMKHEEFIVFPNILKMVRTSRANASFWQTVQDPISSMMHDHIFEVDTLKRLADLTNNYTPPQRSDYALDLTYKAMKELEEDLKMHMHLENNILFPRALDYPNTARNHMN